MMTHKDCGCSVSRVQIKHSHGDYMGHFIEQYNRCDKCNVVVNQSDIVDTIDYQNISGSDAWQQMIKNTIWGLK